MCTHWNSISDEIPVSNCKIDSASFVMYSHWNSLIEAISLSTYNISLYGEVRKIFGCFIYSYVVFTSLAEVCRESVDRQ